MRLPAYSRIIATAVALCLLPAAVFAQEFSQLKRNTNAPPKPSGTTPRTADGHPDLTGLWNGLGDNLLGVPNQIANWEGDTLVVDTWGFNSNTWFDQLGGYFHSENMHVIERFHRDGNTLTWTATVDDPDVLLEPWTTTPRVALLNPRPNAMLPESQPCSERDLSHVVTKEHH